MITPFEIESKEFSKSMRGYNVEEVDEFLDIIIVDLQNLLAENDNLKNTVKNLQQDLNQYKRSEASVLNTLESAKKLMNDISESAEKRAEIIIHNAQAEADSIQRDARESVSKLTEEGEKLKFKVAKFRERYRQLLEDQLSQIEGSSEELFADLEREFMPASLDGHEDEKSGTKKQEMHTYRQSSESAGKTAPHSAKSFSGSMSSAEKKDLDDTMIVSDRSLDDMLMENFGIKNSGDLGKTMVIDDLSKTRIVK